MDQAADSRPSRRPDNAFELGRRALSKAQSPGRRPGLRAVEDDLDRADRVSEGFLVRVGVQLDDRNLGRKRLRDVVA
jgi:hypothetical protein